jgi:RHS repeat-associated protein
MAWDAADRLQQVAQTDDSRAYYAYDRDGQRMRKVIDRSNGTRRSERRYLNGFEVYREYSGNGNAITLSRETLHVMDDPKQVSPTEEAPAADGPIQDVPERIALVEMRTQGNDGSPAQLVRYQMANPLRSSLLELDAAGQIISYEEYYPFGGTGYQTQRSQTETPKRYRYTSKERDEESGFYYHHARYYAPWLGRWTAADPAGMRVGLNVYEYGYNNPLTFSDPAGAQPSPNAPAQTHLGELVEKVRAGGQGSARERVQQILTETSQNLGAINFGGWVRSGPAESGDTGFRPALQDPWVSSRFQVGHFLTAVSHALNGIPTNVRTGIGFAQAARATPLIGGILEDATSLAGYRATAVQPWEVDVGPGAGGTALGPVWSNLTGVNRQDRAFAIWVDVGHEAVSDAYGPLQQLGTISRRDIEEFQQAVNQISHDPNGTVDLDRLAVSLARLGTRLGLTFNAQTGRQGNSMQDLLLTALGYGFADMLRSGAFANAEQAADWLQRNLGTTISGIDLVAAQHDDRPGNEIGTSEIQRYTR